MTHSNNNILGISVLPAGVLARKVVTRSRARPTGKYPSWKMGRMLQWESLYERMAFQLLDADPSAMTFQEQPAVITYSLDGIVHKHIPDVLVKFRHGPELWEIKPVGQAHKPEVQARTELMQRQLPILGFTYRMILGHDLERNPRYANVCKILKVGASPVPLLAWERIRQVFAQVPAVTWMEIQRGAFGADGLRYACRLALEGHLRIDLSAPLGPRTLVTWLAAGHGNGEVL